jgi:hypothetical protein
MGPSEDPSTAPQNQGTNQAKTPWRKSRARRPRQRVCLLKACHRIFRPQHALTRYCSDDCREQARQWREWKARHRYRRSEGGKQKRQAQPPAPMASEGSEGTKNGYRRRREGHRHKIFFGYCCDRPGCYAKFQRSRRSPLQRFCCHACRRALERVLERERRWRERQPARR